MFRRIVFSAVGAGFAACLAITALQLFTTEPLILHAEVFETAGEAAHHHAAVANEATPAATHAHEHAQDAWEPADGFERTAFTALANLLMGIAASLVLLSLMVLKGEPIDARRGLLWGLGGFAAASLLPSLGLPPELPGTPAAELLSRQTWWLGTVAASAFGLGLLAFGRHWAWRGLGLALLVVPHVIGAPEPPSFEAAYPAGLAGEFVVASLVVSALLWSLSGLAGGWLHRRLAAGG
jgi:cobalt transporter subunit CbtA